jgi:ribosomal protein RSM22 (predicted rRNA methylase)
VIAAYALTEIAPGTLPGAISRLWGATGSRILIVEPGTPEGWRRGLEVRQELIALGARILGPCPHAGPCPISAPDWCHFSQRLPRSRDHRRAKGGEAPFEDEKFFWIAAARPGQYSPAPPVSRVIAPPRTSKAGVRLRLCRPDGTVEDVDFARRDRAALVKVRRLDWGDALPEDGPPEVGGQ